MNKKLFNSTNAKQTQRFAQDFAKKIKGGDILCFYGDLGSGKTTFIQGFVKGLGITQRIISPTFIIIRKYEINDMDFYHIDLYRVGLEQDLFNLGIEEILFSKKNIVTIEWAEKLGSLLPKRRYDLVFSYVNENSRNIEITKNG